MSLLVNKQVGIIQDVQVFDILRDRISRHDIPPGSMLREQSLALEFGISRARVRDIFSMLHERGLIDRIPNKGAIVTRLDLTTALELFDVREVNEGLCARLATEANRPEIWERLLKQFDREVSQAVSKGKLEVYVAALAEMRQLMQETAANPILTDILERIQDRTRMLVRRIVILPGRVEQGLVEMKKILDAMRRGDAEAAEKLRRENIRSAREWLQRYESFLC